MNKLLKLGFGFGIGIGILILYDCQSKKFNGSDKEISDYVDSMDIIS